MKMTENITQYLDSHRQEAYDLLLELAQIPAPSNREEARAEFCLQWLHRNGVKQAFIDDALNVVCSFGCTESNTAAVFMAHSDVVFPDTTPLPLSVSDGKIFCPGVWDDTANVVAVLFAARFLSEHGLMPKDCGVLLVINSGEEGLGNLKGSRKIMENFGSRVTEFITFDGSVNPIVNKAVGSRRFRIEIHTEGGHSYSKFGNRNAIACLASLIDRLYAIQVPPIGQTTYNVGTVSGGTSVNTIAQYAQMLYEFRSDEQEALEIMQAHLDRIIAEFQAKGIQVTVTMIGSRPCGRYVDSVRETALMSRAAEAVKDHFGYDVSFRSGSTDCNIPLSMGIPSISVSCAEGEGAHTREEYVCIDSLRPGLGLAFQLILYHF